MGLLAACIYDRTAKHTADTLEWMVYYWHGIMHRREGDFSNSHYWFRKVGNHPAIAVVREACGGDYDPHAFIDEAEAACMKGESPTQLVRRQQIEWMTLFAWSAAG